MLHRMLPASPRLTGCSGHWWPAADPNHSGGRAGILESPRSMRDRRNALLHKSRLDSWLCPLPPSHNVSGPIPEWPLQWGGRELAASDRRVDGDDDARHTATL